MKFEFDKPTSDMSIVKGVEVHLKSGDIEHYDPVVLLNILDDVVIINNTYYDYYVKLNDISKIIVYNRNPNYDVSVDLIWYKDTDYETIWKSEK